MVLSSLFPKKTRRERLFSTTKRVRVQLSLLCKGGGGGLVRLLRVVVCGVAASVSFYGFVRGVARTLAIAAVTVAEVGQDVRRRAQGVL